MTRAVWVLLALGAVAQALVLRPRDIADPYAWRDGAAFSPAGSFPGSWDTPPAVFRKGWVLPDGDPDDIAWPWTTGCDCGVYWGTDYVSAMDGYGSLLDLGVLEDTALWVEPVVDLEQLRISCYADPDCASVYAVLLAPKTPDIEAIIDYHWHYGGCVFAEPLEDMICARKWGRGDALAAAAEQTYIQLEDEITAFCRYGGGLGKRSRNDYTDPGLAAECRAVLEAADVRWLGYGLSAASGMSPWDLDTVPVDPAEVCTDATPDSREGWEAMLAAHGCAPNDTWWENEWCYTPSSDTACCDEECPGARATFALSASPYYRAEWNSSHRAPDYDTWRELRREAALDRWTDSQWARAPTRRRHWDLYWNIDRVPGALCSGDAWRAPATTEEAEWYLTQYASVLDGTAPGASDVAAAGWDWSAALTAAGTDAAARLALAAAHWNALGHMLRLSPHAGCTLGQGNWAPASGCTATRCPTWTWEGTTRDDANVTSALSDLGVLGGEPRESIIRSLWRDHPNKDAGFYAPVGTEASSSSYVDPMAGMFGRRRRAQARTDPYAAALQEARARTIAAAGGHPPRPWEAARALRRSVVTRRGLGFWSPNGDYTTEDYGEDSPFAVEFLSPAARGVFAVEDGLSGAQWMHDSPCGSGSSAGDGRGYCAVDVAVLPGGATAAALGAHHTRRAGVCVCAPGWGAIGDEACEIAAANPVFGCVGDDSEVCHGTRLIRDGDTAVATLAGACTVRPLTASLLLGMAASGNDTLAPAGCGCHEAWGGEHCEASVCAANDGACDDNTPRGAICGRKSSAHDWRCDCGGMWDDAGSPSRLYGAGCGGTEPEDGSCWAPHPTSYGRYLWGCNEGGCSADGPRGTTRCDCDGSGLWGATCQYEDCDACDDPWGACMLPQGGGAPTCACAVKVVTADIDGCTAASPCQRAITGGPGCGTPLCVANNTQEVMLLKEGSPTSPPFAACDCKPGWSGYLCDVQSCPSVTRSGSTVPRECGLTTLGRGGTCNRASVAEVAAGGASRCECTCAWCSASGYCLCDPTASVVRLYTLDEATGTCTKTCGSGGTYAIGSTSVDACRPLAVTGTARDTLALEVGVWGPATAALGSSGVAATKAAWALWRCSTTVPAPLDAVPDRCAVPRCGAGAWDPARGACVCDRGWGGDRCDACDGTRVGDECRPCDCDWNAGGYCDATGACACMAPFRHPEGGPFNGTGACAACTGGYWGSACTACPIPPPNTWGMTCNDGFHGDGALVCPRGTTFAALTPNVANVSTALLCVRDADTAAHGAAFVHALGATVGDNITEAFAASDAFLAAFPVLSFRSLMLLEDSLVASSGGLVDPDAAAAAASSANGSAVANATTNGSSSSSSSSSLVCGDRTWGPTCAPCECGTINEGCGRDTGACACVAHWARLSGSGACVVCAPGWHGVMCADAEMVPSSSDAASDSSVASGTDSTSGSSSSSDVDVAFFSTDNTFFVLLAAVGGVAVVGGSIALTLRWAVRVRGASARVRGKKRLAEEAEGEGEEATRSLLDPAGRPSTRPWLPPPTSVDTAARLLVHGSEVGVVRAARVNRRAALG